MAGHRREHAEERWRHRVSDGRPSTRAGHHLGVSDGWNQSLAANVAGGQAGGLSLGQRRQIVAAPGSRVAENAGVADGQTTGDDSRSGISRRRLLWHQ